MNSHCIVFAWPRRMFCSRLRQRQNKNYDNKYVVYTSLINQARWSHFLRNGKTIGRYQFRMCQIYIHPIYSSNLGCNIMIKWIANKRNFWNCVWQYEIFPSRYILYILFVNCVIISSKLQPTYQIKINTFQNKQECHFTFIIYFIKHYSCTGMSFWIS